jgi:DNA-binding CsgD family transcriptional regulator
VTAVTPGVPVISPALAELYRWVLLHHGLVDTAARAAVAEATGSSPQEVAAGLATLVSLRLLRPSPNRPGVLLAASPDVAIAELVGPIETEIRDRQRRADTLKSELSTLHRFYSESSRGRDAREAFDVVDDAERVRATLADLSRRCTVEVFCAHPGVLSDRTVTECAPRDADLLARGVRMRSMYQHPVRVHPRTREFLAVLARAGAAVRTCAEIPDRIVILDREVAVVPDRAGSGGAVVVREPSVVDVLYRGLEQRWASALPLPCDDAPAGGYGAAGSGVRQAILRLLATGAKDEHIARRLGISVRTCRRHIAELLDELRATSRFQAGVRAAGAGLLPDSTESMPVSGADSRVWTVAGTCTAAS